jgi:hypothetical protein
MPDYTTAPPSALFPFRSALAGLGQECVDVDPDTGACLDIVTTTGGDTTGGGSTPIYGPTIEQLTGGAANCAGILDAAGDCISSADLQSLESCGANASGGISCNSGANAVNIPASTVQTWSNFPTNTSSYYVDANGNIIVPFSNGNGYYTLNPNGTLSQTSNASAPTKAAAYTSSAANAAQAAMLQSAITQAGTVARILALSPGQSINAQGVITYNTPTTSGTLFGLPTSTVVIGLVVLAGILVLGNRR